jgi:putative (di)nucleoside polyphosphate hydrolase
MREMMEEIGTNKAEIIREHKTWLNYDLPDELIGVVWQGKYRGQRQKWFALRFLGEKEDINLSGQGHDQEFSNWKWAPMADLPKMVVPFKRALYAKVVKAFADLAKPAAKKSK